MKIEKISKNGNLKLFEKLSEYNLRKSKKNKRF